MVSVVGNARFHRWRVVIPSLAAAVAGIMIAVAIIRDETSPLDPALIATVSAGPATAPVQPAVVLATNPLAGPLPTPVRFAPGETVDAGRGVYYVDPRTGAVEGWQLPDTGASAYLPIYPTSPTGRYLRYAVAAPGESVPVRERLYDTRTGTARELGPTSYYRFAADDSRFFAAGEDGITITRVEDGTVERTVDLTAFGYAHEYARGGEWSPDGRHILLWFALGAEDPLIHRIVRIDTASGIVTPLHDGLLAQAGWSPDGQQYVVTTHTNVEARDTADDHMRWRLGGDELGMPGMIKAGAEPLGGITTPFYSPDGANAVILTSNQRALNEPADWRVHVIDPRRGVVLFRVQNALSCGRRWTADGRWLHVVGFRGDQAGSFLIAAGGSEMRFLGRFVEDVSPVDARLGGYLAREEGFAINVIDLDTGAVRPLTRMTGDPGWDVNHDPPWLNDGRMVVHAAHPGHGGCGFSERSGNLTVDEQR